jgi:hypothetical protein
MMGRQARASTVIMRRWEPHDPGGSCLHHTIGRYRVLPHDRTDRENAGALTLGLLIPDATFYLDK